MKKKEQTQTGNEVSVRAQCLGQKRESGETPNTAGRIYINWRFLSALWVSLDRTAEREHGVPNYYSSLQVT